MSITLSADSGPRPRLLPIPSPASPQMSADALETELLAGALAGDSVAWARLYHLHFARLYRDILYLVRDPSTAEELAQESFAIAVTGLGNYVGQSGFLAWLRGIAHNLVRKSWRSAGRRDRAYDRFAHTIERSAVSTSVDPAASMLQRQRANGLWLAVEALPEGLRETFLMRDVQGLSSEDVAKRLGTTPGNIRVRANRARTKIRAHLEQQGLLGPEDAS